MVRQTYRAVWLMQQRLTSKQNSEQSGLQLARHVLPQLLLVREVSWTRWGLHATIGMVRQYTIVGELAAGLLVPINDGRIACQHTIALQGLSSCKISCMQQRWAPEGNYDKAQ